MREQLQIYLILFLLVVTIIMLVLNTTGVLGTGGPKGDPGTDGPKGDPGTDGPKGDPGTDGIDSLYIDPIRNDTFPVKSMNYNPSSKEVVYTNMGNYIQLQEPGDSIIDSNSFVVIGRMSVSPPGGNYMATFSCWLENGEAKSADGIEIAIYSNDSLYPHSIRRSWTGEAGKYETSIHTQAIVSISQGDVISVKAHKLGADAIRIAHRSLILISLGTIAS